MAYLVSDGALPNCDDHCNHCGKNTDQNLNLCRHYFKHLLSRNWCASRATVGGMTSVSEVATYMGVVITIKQMPKKATVKVGRSEKPITNRKSQIHIPFHHDGMAMMGCVMTTQRINQRAIADKPAFANVTTEMHKLVYEVHSYSGGDKKPADIGGDQPTSRQGWRDRQKGEHYQSIGGEKGNSPVT